MNVRLKRTPGLYLVGFMGSGKTTVGRHLAHRLGWTFFDLDRMPLHLEEASFELDRMLYDIEVEAQHEWLRTMMAFDDATMQTLWKINVGVGFDAPPMTFEVGGKQYVAILSGLSRIAMGRHINTPELKEQRNQTMLFVFGL